MRGGCTYGYFHLRSKQTEGSTYVISEARTLMRKSINKYLQRFELKHSQVKLNCAKLNLNKCTFKIGSTTPDMILDYYNLSRL